MWRVGIVALLLIALLSPMSGVAASSRSSQGSTFGVTGYEWLYYNSQVCSSETFYQLYRWEFRFQRTSETRRANYRGLAKAEGRDCGRFYRKYVVGGDTTTFYIPCWGPCGNSSSPLWSRTQVFSVSNMPYVTAATIGASWVGAALDVHAYDSNWTEFGSFCLRIVLSGPVACP